LNISTSSNQNWQESHGDDDNEVSLIQERNDYSQQRQRLKQYYYNKVNA
jgi:CMP-N-acetylneuraminic acid synthetase